MKFLKKILRNLLTFEKIYDILNNKKVFKGKDWKELRKIN